MEDFVVEEEEISIDEEGKFNQLMDDLYDYCKYYQLPFLLNNNTCTIFKKLLDIQE